MDTLEELLQVHGLLIVNMVVAVVLSTLEQHKSIPEVEIAAAQVVIKVLDMSKLH